MKSPQTFYALPVEVQAIQYDGDNLREVATFVGHDKDGDPNWEELTAKNEIIIWCDEEVAHTCPQYHWIVRNVDEKFLVIDPEDFSERYAEKQ